MGGVAAGKDEILHFVQDDKSTVKWSRIISFVILSEAKDLNIIKTLKLSRNHGKPNREQTHG